MIAGEQRSPRDTGHRCSFPFAVSLRAAAVPIAILRATRSRVHRYGIRE